MAAKFDKNIILVRPTRQSNYQLCGDAIGEDLVGNPDLVPQNAVVSFKTAMWFWTTAQGNKPSCEDVALNRWTPTAADTAAGRVPGYGVITNIINGGVECGKGQDSRVADRIGYYTRYCGLLGTDTGGNLDCYSQRNFAS
jgi:chitinase